MSLRALFIFSPNGALKGKDPVLYSRYFSTVEKRAKILHGENYEILPTGSEACAEIFRELQIFRFSPEFNSEMDSCKSVKHSPVYKLLSTNHLLAVAIRKNNLVFCCIPLVEDLSLIEPEVNFTKLVCLSVSYTILHSFADVVGSTSFEDETWNAKLVEIQQYLSLCMPFGSPIESSPSTVRGILASRNQSLQKFKMPAWRPYAPKGKQTISFLHQEQIRAVQYGKGHISDVCEIFGSISCKADLEGAPEISLNLMAPVVTAAVDEIAYHPCVMVSDDSTSTVTGVDKDIDMPYAVKPLRFCPPLETFTLCHYKAKPDKNLLPVQAYYQMKMEETSAKILVQLKLSEKIRNSFEFFNVHIPFFNRGPVKTFNFLPPSASISINQERSAVIWSIGQKFPRSLEISLEGTVDFVQRYRSDDVVLKDQFCTGMNSFLQIYFKTMDFTLSGLRVDSRSLALLPRGKAKNSTSSELMSSEYKVWNSHGDAIYAPTPNVFG